jgi:uncharacterized protein YcfJ
MNRLSAIAAATLALMLALPAMAGGGHSRVTYARVTGVEPLTRVIEVSTPREECWDEEVVHEARGSDRGGMILGGIIGGAIGSRFGEGNGKKAATIAGTLLGAGVGDRMRGRSHGDDTYTSTERRCRTVEDRHTEERTIGYRVFYRYHGEEYVTRMNRHPGKRIRVRVTVTPEE